MNDSKELLIFTVMCFLMVIIGSMASCDGKDLGHEEATQEFQIEAVKRGAGEWVVSGDGTTTFKWRDLP